ADRDGPWFEAPVPPGGYFWVYLDAVSACSRYGLTLIAFVGSVFSPYYRAKGWAAPEDHVAINLALYGAKPAWAMTERGKAALSRGRDHFAVGTSRLTWTGDGLEIVVDERQAPLPFPLRGVIGVRPLLGAGPAQALDPRKRHFWRPIAPVAEVTVAFAAPAARWRGLGYLDSNWGAEPLEAGFRAWTWSRVHRGAAEALILYDCIERSGAAQQRGFRCTAAGVEPWAAAGLAPARLPRSFWGLQPVMRCDAGARPRLKQSWEDTPFYTRALVEAPIGGAPAIGVQEWLDLDRLRLPLVQEMLKLRMPRRKF
ncbi:MAG TPA: hypothetical protein DCZ49_09240, partial [Hyphomonadaceae bacterium]|nr:hypothetical protein [Hyphomonadaceae bacterium]